MIITNFQSGISSGKYLQNGFNSLTNCEIHEEPGTVTCQNALEQVTDVNAPDETCIFVEDFNGVVYALSKESGKIWKLSGGTWSLAHTNANVQHKGGIYFNGYLYYATSTKLGRYDLASTWEDSYQTFANGSVYKPMARTLGSIAIGDGKYIASVDLSGTWSQEALDLPEEYSAISLINVETDLLIGSKAVGKPAKVFRWDNIENSWFDDYDTGDEGVNSFFSTGGQFFIQHGKDGKISVLTGGARFQNFKRIRGVETQDSHYKTTVHKGRGLIAVGDSIYSIFSMDGINPVALSHEYTCSQAGATIHSIHSTGNNLLVSWVKDSTKGVDQIGTNKATAIFETQVFLGKYKQIKVFYEDKPTGSTITLEKKLDNGDWQSYESIQDDEKNRTIQSVAHTVNKSMVQYRVTLTPNGANAPIINAIEIY